MSYMLQFIFCNGVVGQTLIEPGENPYQVWANYTDRLLLGEELSLKVPEVGPEDHCTKVVLAYQAGEDPWIPVCSMFLLCEHDIPVEQGTKITSDLLLPTSKLVLP